MIVNTGARTDTVQYYTDWLLRRFAEGYVLSRNPLFPNKVTRYELTPEKVDCVVFCSKNYAPILPRLHEITERFPTYFYYTITAYGKDVEPGVPSIEQSMETLMALSRQVGKGRVAWRYDPVLLTRKYTINRHMETFERMAATLAPHIDRCIFSFVEMYKKLESNMPEIIPFRTGRWTRWRGDWAASPGSTAFLCRPAAPTGTIPATASIPRANTRSSVTASRSGSLNTRARDRAATASRAATSALTTPA